VSTCPTELQKLMAECWQFDATQRPFFPIIAQRLQTMYAAMFGDEDPYLTVSAPDGMGGRKSGKRGSWGREGMTFYILVMQLTNYSC
jgi:hypothetical protein